MTHVFKILDRQTRHLDDCTDRSINILTCQQTCSVGSKFRHSNPIHQCIIDRRSEGADYRNLTNSIVEHLTHHVINHVTALDMPHLMTYYITQFILLQQIHSTTIQDQQGILLISCSITIDVIPPLSIKTGYRSNIQSICDIVN